MSIEAHDRHHQSSARMALEAEYAREDSSATEMSPSTGGARKTSLESQSDVSTTGLEVGARSRSSGKWWALAAMSAAALIFLTVAAAYLLTRGPATVDQTVIITVPSGAVVTLNSRDYGQTPIKIEQLPEGDYTLTITKNNYETIVDHITISRDSQPFEYNLKLVPPADSTNLPIEEQIKQFQDRAEQAFINHRYVNPENESALYYAQLISERDPSNLFASEMRERIRATMLSLAEAERKHNDLWHAKEILGQLAQYYPGDREVLAARARLESEISARRGNLRDLVSKAREALARGNFAEPARESALFYAKQALTIDSQNAEALAIQNEVRQKLLTPIDQAKASGDIEAEIRQLVHFLQHFNEREMRDRLQEVSQRRAAELDPDIRRAQGLAKYRRSEYNEAIRDLQFVMVNGGATAEAIFALAHSYWKLRQYDQAINYFKQVPQTAGEQYCSAIAAMGDIAGELGDNETALRRYHEARGLGGSTMYSLSNLNYKIEGLEKRQQEKATAPMPLSIQVRHLHSGFLGGSCQGVLTVDATGVTYRSTENDDYSANLVLVGLRVNAKGELTVQGFTKGPQRFKTKGSDGERFREAVARYQIAAK